ncbi:hypothetical protein KIL84_002424 [Mauremys mutica]|uniref:Uncharacterized protein n=1 Tax=Mauremys mutica TaxID=74926 RepID=A0A9D3X7T6_9SAUR|nr:hypothetical protein KIL84_002424 [Mauremys mutica]
MQGWAAGEGRRQQAQSLHILCPRGAWSDPASHHTWAANPVSASAPCVGWKGKPTGLRYTHGFQPSQCEAATPQGRTAVTQNDLPSAQPAGLGLPAPDPYLARI